MTIGYVGTDWEQTPDPYINRQVDLADLWPQGVGGDAAGGDKGVLVDGNHPILAIGPRASRATTTQTGVVVTYTSAATRAVLNIGRGFICRQNVESTLTYDNGDPATFVTSVAVGQPVYLDDSGDLAAANTLSFSPLNDAGATNPLVGWIAKTQTEFDDSGIGGASASQAWPVVLADEQTVAEFAIMLK